MSKFSHISCAAVAVFFSITTYAQQPALTKADVRNVIDAAKELRTEIDKSEDYNFEKMTEMGATLKGQAMYNKYLGIIKSYGFANPETWAQTATRVFSAYGAYEMQRTAPNLNAQMQQALSQIQNNPNLTAEQKQQMMQMMGQARQSTRSYASASSADIEVVKPFAAEIEAEFGKNR